MITHTYPSLLVVYCLFQCADPPARCYSATAAIYLPSPSTPSSAELLLGHAQPESKWDPATETLKVMNMWDFREYMFALDNLEENLVPASRYSWKCLAARCVSFRSVPSHAYPTLSLSDPRLHRLFTTYKQAAG